MLKPCLKYHELKPILGDRNTDATNPGNSCGNIIIQLVAYTSPFTTSSVASSPTSVIA